MRLFANVLLFFSLSCYSQGIEAFYNRAIEAENGGKHGSALELFQQVDELLPNHPSVLFHIAHNAAVVDIDLATQTLFRLVLINADTALLSDSLISLMPNIHEIAKEFEEMNKMITSSEVVFEITDSEFHPEGIAVSAEGRYYVTSIRKGQVVEYDKKGTLLRTFTDERFGALSGVAVQGQKLWVTSPPAPQYSGFDSLVATSRIFTINLVTEAVDEIKISLDGPDYLGEIQVFDGDNVISTDSSIPRLLIIENEQFKKSLSFDSLVNVQGVCSNENRLFFSDYRLGIFYLDLPHGNISKIELPVGMSAKGTDGLCYYNGSLLLIQNGLSPRRITRAYLDESETRIVDFKYLEKANPQLNEPTLGTVVNGELIYVGNSPWSFYDDKNNFSTTPPPGLIMKVRLDD